MITVTTDITSKVKVLHRNLFPEKSYDDQTFNTSERCWSYEEYIHGGKPSETSPQGKPLSRGHGGTMLKVLRRGRSSRVDRFLDWMVSLSVKYIKSV